MNPRLVNQIAAHLYGGIKDFPRFDTLIEMAPVASVFANYLAMQLRNNNRGEIDSIFAEKNEDGIWIRPSFEDAIKEMRVVIVEDVITSGKTVMSLKRRLEEMECTVVGVVSIASRMIWTPANMHYFNLVQINDSPVPRSECSKCLAGEEHNKNLGHG